MNENIKNTAWEQMRELLDSEMPVKKRWLLFPFWKIAAVLIPLLFIGTVILYQLGNDSFSIASSHSKLDQTKDSQYDLLNKEKSAVLLESVTQGEKKYPDPSYTKTGSAAESASHLVLTQLEVLKTEVDHHLSLEALSTGINPEIKHIGLSAEIFPGYSDLKDTDHFEQEISIFSESKIEVKRGPNLAQDIGQISLLNQLLGLPLSLFRSSGDSLFHSSHFSEPFEAERKSFSDRKYRGIAINGGWELPLQQKIHGLGIAAGPVFDLGKFRINPLLGIHHFGWFNQSGSYSLFQSRSASSETINFFTPPQLISGLDQAQKQALYSYSEVTLNIGLKYRFKPRWALTTGINSHRVFNIRYNANAISFLDDFSTMDPFNDPEEQQAVLEYIGGETVNWINNYRLSAELGFQFNWTRSYAIRVAYRQALSPFWSSHNDGAGSSFNAALVIYAF